MTHQTSIKKKKTKVYTPKKKTRYPVSIFNLAPEEQQIFMDRFFTFFKEGPKGDCWLWQGRYAGGSPSLYITGTILCAHRISYELYREKIPDDKKLTRLCTNDMCVNPYHYTLKGTQKKAPLSKGIIPPQPPPGNKIIRFLKNLFKGKF
jgi:hypothetical protein